MALGFLLLLGQPPHGVLPGGKGEWLQQPALLSGVFVSERQGYVNMLKIGFGGGG